MRLLPILCLLTAASVVHASTFVPGDVNLDTKVTISDAVEALKYASGIASPSAASFVNGDVAADSENVPDGQITLLDCVRILRAASGLDPKLAALKLPTMSITDTVSVVEDTDRNYVLPTGSWLSGRVYNGDGTPAEVSLTVSNPSTKTSTHASVYNQGLYDLAVSPGTVTPNLFASELISGGGVSINWHLSAFTMPGNASRNFVVPPVPALAALSGTVSAPGFAISTLSFLPSDITSAATATWRGTFAGPTYHVQNSPGTVYATLDGTYSADPGVNLEASLGGEPFTVAPDGTSVANITIAPLVPYTVTVVPPSGATVSSISLGPSVYDYSKNIFTATKSLAGNTTGTLAAPPGDYYLGISLAHVQTTQGAFVSAGYGMALTVPEGGGSTIVTLPPLPTTKILSGTVTDSTGAPASVPMRLSAVTTATNGYAVGRIGGSDSSGHFSFIVLPGNYQVMINVQ